MGGLVNGGFVIAWRSDSQDGSGAGVYAQRYDVNGQAVGDEFRVNTTTLSTQDEPAVLGLSDGSFVVAYSSVYSGSNATYDVLAQRYAAAKPPCSNRINTSPPSMPSSLLGGVPSVWLRLMASCNISRSAISAM